LLRDPENLESKFICDMLGPSAGSILEVGCGDGRLTEEISNVSSSIFALDPDPAALKKARPLQGNGISLILGSGENIPLADKSIDTVIFSLSLHHHTDPVLALSQAWRVLRKGGRILIMEPDSGSLFNQCFKLVHNEDEAYEKAAGAVNVYSTDLVDSGVFTCITEYDDFRELVEHLYSYVDTEPDISTVKAMESMLGSAAKDRPVLLEESTRWWLLQSGSDVNQIPRP
jgi:ubiquinone/menaquinone biosynthesis C-methylase UbiE